MSFEPIKPSARYPPLKVADDTWLIQQMQCAVIGPLWVYLHSLVINGPEPIIVDTGTPVNRQQWMQDVRSLVDPGDVRWIFLSHDDIDHADLEVLKVALATGREYVWQPPAPA